MQYLHIETIISNIYDHFIIFINQKFINHEENKI